MQPEKAANRHNRIEAILLTAISAAVFSGLLFVYLYAVGHEKSTSKGITIRYHSQLNYLYGTAIGLVGAANFLAWIWFHFFISTENMQRGFKKALLNCSWFPLTFSFLITVGLSFVGWLLFFVGCCDWIRIDSDQVTSGFFVTTRSLRFDQIKEVEFTEVRTEHKKKNGDIDYSFSPTVEFELSSSEKVTWSGYPLIYIEQEFQQMLELKEIRYSNRRSQSYLSEKNESSDATRGDTQHHPDP